MLASAGVVVTQNLGLLVQLLDFNHHTVAPVARALLAVGHVCLRVTCGAMSDYATAVSFA